MTRYFAMHSKLRGVLFLAILLCCATPARCQSTFGDIIGVVKDPGQGLVGSAQVTLTSVEEQDEHSATTDSDGFFHFVNLKPGHYTLLVKVAGFSDYKVASLQLDARQSLRLDVALKLATSSQT